MATYKVLQDIEAEDKFVGPLTLKQFIFAAITAVSLYISVLTLTNGVWIVTVMLLPFILIPGFLAWPWSRDQPTEIWLLARIRFFFKPRRRIWDQSGQAELVTITVPKKVDKHLVSDLSQGEVQSRLKNLASTIDSRGWAIKNVNVNLFDQPAAASVSSDRLIDPMSLPREVPAIDVLPGDDILDPKNNPTAMALDQMMNASMSAHRQETLERMRASASSPAGQTQAEDAPTQWFMNQPGNIQGATTKTPTAEEQAVLERVKAEHAKPAPAYGHMRVVNPLHPASGAPQNAPQTSSASAPDPAILGLASNDDLNVATIAREANRQQKGLSDEGEVVIPLR